MECWRNCVDSSKVPKHRVELHVHLDGAARPETLWEIAQSKGIDLGNSLEDFRSACTTKQPLDLCNFLAPFGLFLPVIAGDAKALERIAFEFCEDAALQHVLYTEARYSPHLLSSSTLTPSQVVESINRGLAEGAARFGVTVRTLLCCIRGKPGWSKEIVQLCDQFRNKGVVGIDIAGDTQAVVDTSKEDVEAFQLARELGIHRTVHAGEDGPAEQVRFALNHLHAERIGHGYHLVDDDALYQQCLKLDLHFETCPISSFLTGSATNKYKKHPIARFAEDGANFSVSRDDPTIIQKGLHEDYALLKDMGLTEVHLVRANFNAARSSFLPEDEKKLLLQELGRAYGVPLL
ncbi:adenosine deaminase [Caerostris darwini]|uniref:adenosine deaminase n=1 Tax=Caerostris darwini TaxID=1538125 RepID=A0AAV4QLR8_9ARAC|nr:adenosine deaminase [Caerostris darwini]